MIPKDVVLELPLQYEAKRQRSSSEASSVKAPLFCAMLSCCCYTDDTGIHGPKDPSEKPGQPPDPCTSFPQLFRVKVPSKSIGSTANRAAAACIFPKAKGEDSLVSGLLHGNRSTSGIEETATKVRETMTTPTIRRKRGSTSMLGGNPDGGSSSSSDPSLGVDFTSSLSAVEVQTSDSHLEESAKPAKQGKRAQVKNACSDCRTAKVKVLL